jgi:iron complex transport system ATP-binding protein
MVEPVLEARGVSAGYPGRPVLKALDFQAFAGELVAVIGPNGAGKSTLVRALAGTLTPDAGEVRLFGRRIDEMPRREIARRLAVVPGERRGFGFTVRQVVMMGRAPPVGAAARPAEDERAVDFALERAELAAVADRPVGELSGGERRRVVIARALAQSGDVLLLDEPAAHLDMRHAVALYETARREVEDRKVMCLAVMHDLAAAARWADRALLMVDGEAVALGPIDEVLEPSLLEPAWRQVASRSRSGRGHRYFRPSSLTPLLGSSMRLSRLLPFGASLLARGLSCGRSSAQFAELFGFSPSRPRRPLRSSAVDSPRQAGHAHLPRRRVSPGRRCAR